MEKSSIFVDGGYLNRIKRKLNVYDIDFFELSESICKMLDTRRLRTYYYNCMPLVRKGNKEDEKRFSKMQSFMTNIKRLPRFEVRLGKLQNIDGKFRQKMVDVLMSIDIIDMCFDKQIESVVVIAGDADFVPAIKKAKNYGAIVHLFYHPDSVHNELLDTVDELHEINEGLLNS